MQIERDRNEVYIYMDYLHEVSDKVDYYFYIETNKKHTYLMSEILNNKRIVVYHNKRMEEMVVWDDENTFYHQLQHLTLDNFFLLSA